MAKMKKAATVEEYIGRFPAGVQRMLRRMRETVRKALPKDALEKISYGIPTYTLSGNLIHFAGYDHHISLYPGAAAIQAFKGELARYKLAVGTVQFPLDRPLPLALVTRLARFAVQERLAKRAAAATKKKRLVKRRGVGARATGKALRKGTRR